MFGPTSCTRSMSTFWSSVERPSTISRLVMRNSAREPCNTPSAPFAVAARAVAACADAVRQGLTLVHFSAPCQRFLWYRECIQGLCKGCLGVGQGYQGVFRCILCQKRLRLS